MQWCRLWRDFATDVKVQSMTEQDQRRLIILFCLQTETPIEKLIDDEISFALRISLDEWQKTKKIFIEKRFCEARGGGVKLKNWDKRQFVSDNSKVRVKEYRTRLQKQRVTVTDYSKHKDYIFNRDNGACVYCGSNKNLCIDHLIPLILGGDSEIDNLVTACKKCNAGKSGRTPEMAQKNIINQDTVKQYELVKTRLKNVTVTVTAPDVTVTAPNVTVTAPDTDTDTDTETDTEKNKNPCSTPLNFDQFWQAYPRKQGKGACKKIWKRLKPSPELFETMLKAVEAQRESGAWKKEGGKFIPMPATWLNQERWDDEISVDDDEEPYYKKYLRIHGKAPHDA